MRRTPAWRRPPTADRAGPRSKVTGVALDLGYDGPGAFIAMFKRGLGATPGRYFR